MAWQVQLFHNHVHRRMPFCRWYDEKGTRHNNGKAQVQAWSHTCCPGLASVCVRSARSAAGKATWQVTNVGVPEPAPRKEACVPQGPFSDMWSTVWLLIYLRRPALPPQRAWASMADRSMQLLQMLCHLATEQEVCYTTALAGEVILSRGRVKLSVQKMSVVAAKVLQSWTADTTTKLGMVCDPSSEAG